jgi:transcriptional regulator NrdR family protein
MTCPICGGRTGVASTVKDVECVYRKRVCKECGNIVFTTETECPEDRSIFLNLRNKQMRESLAKHKGVKHEKSRV